MRVDLFWRPDLRNDVDEIVSNNAQSAKFISYFAATHEEIIASRRFDTDHMVRRDFSSGNDRYVLKRDLETDRQTERQY